MLAVVVEDGRLVCEQVSFGRRPGGRSVTSAALRALPVGRILTDSAWKVGSYQEPGDDDPDKLAAKLRKRPAGWPAESLADLPEAMRAGLPILPADWVDDRVPQGVVELLGHLS